MLVSTCTRHEHGDVVCALLSLGDQHRPAAARLITPRVCAVLVQAQKSQGDDRGLRADLMLHAAAPGMPTATLPLTLTPGRLR